MTSFGFCIKPNIEKNNIQYNEYTTILNKTFEDLLEKKSNSRFIWKFFSETNIDPQDYNFNNNQHNTFSYIEEENFGIG